MRTYFRSWSNQDEIDDLERLINTVNDLGSVLASQGKYEEAEAMHRRALEDRRYSG